MAKVDIKCTANGPNLVVVDNKVFAAMCRCGASDTKPYCDVPMQKSDSKQRQKK